MSDIFFCIIIMKRHVADQHINQLFRIGLSKSLSDGGAGLQLCFRSEQITSDEIFAKKNSFSSFGIDLKQRISVVPVKWRHMSNNNRWRQSIRPCIIQNLFI